MPFGWKSRGTCAKAAWVVAEKFQKPRDVKIAFPLPSKSLVDVAWKVIAHEIRPGARLPRPMDSSQSMVFTSGINHTQY